MQYSLRYGAVLFLMLAAVPSALGQIYRPGLEYRSLNTGEYEIAIQKNGRVDVATTAGEAIFLNAYPMVWYADEGEPEVARLDGRNSQRFEVNDRLGRGQGMRIVRKGFEWKLRAYPTKPYFAVQLVYINDTKKPVQIKALLPWCVGDPKKGSVVLGPNTPNSVMLLDSLSGSEPQLMTSAGTSSNMLSIFNPSSGRSLIAGFVTQRLAMGSFELKTVKPDPKEPNQFDFMRSMCVYDPPITVQPGEALESELLYVAVTEPELLIALERYAKAVAVVNEVPNYMEPPKQAIRIARGDRSFLEYRDVILAAVEEIQSSPLPTSDIELLLEVEWAANGVENINAWDSILQQIKAKGFEIGLYFDPFSPGTTPNAEWLVSNREGARALDLSNNAARTWLLTNVSSAQQQLRFDAIWGVNPAAYVSMAPGPSTSIRTGTELARLSMSLLRTAVSSSTRLNVVDSDLFPVTHHSNVISSDFAALRFYQMPHLGFRYVMPESPEAYLHPEVAFATGTQQVLSYTDWPRVAPMLTESRRFFPTIARPSKPQGAFYTPAPDVWLTMESERSGAWILATAANNGDTPRPTTVPIPSASPRVTTQYALFDLGQLHYYGRAAKQVNINVPANSARTLLLREYRGHPTVLGTSRPVAKSTPDRIPQAWSHETMELKGAIHGDVLASTLFVLVPDELKTVSGIVENVAVEWSEENSMVKLTIPASGKNRLDWSIQFARR